MSNGHQKSHQFFLECLHLCLYQKLLELSGKEEYLNYDGVYGDLDDSFTGIACHPSKLVMRVIESPGTAWETQVLQAFIERIPNTGREQLSLCGFSLALLHAKDQGWVILRY